MKSGITIEQIKEMAYNYGEFVEDWRKDRLKEVEEFQELMNTTEEKEEVEG